MLRLQYILFLLLLTTAKAVTAGDTLRADTAGMPDTAASAAESPDSSLIYEMTVDGAIGTVTADRIIDAVDKAEKNHANLLLITMDTPGGFNDALWAITKAIMNSTVPVAVYIYPTGAKAASAGVYITYSAHIAAMAPGTNIGAAHVVSGSGQPMDSILMGKIMNDAVASLKAMAERNGRNAEWAEKAARESVSITSKEALQQNVINFLADDIDDLLKKINGFEVNTVIGEKIVDTSKPKVIKIKKTFVQSFLEIISSPNVAFILFSLGGLGLVIELYNPGAILPGVVGGICLILAFYSFRTLPINYAGLLLIIFAIILFILEVKVTSFGLLAIGGIISLIIGGMMLIDTSNPALRISKTVIIVIALIMAAIIIVVGSLVYKARVSRPTTGQEGLIGQVGVVREKIDAKTGYIFVAGELWQARADEPIDVGEEVMVLGVQNVTLKVARKS